MSQHTWCNVIVYTIDDVVGLFSSILLDIMKSIQLKGRGRGVVKLFSVEGGRGSSGPCFTKQRQNMAMCANSRKREILFQSPSLTDPALE